MNVKFSPVVITVCILLGGVLPAVSFAATTSTTTSTAAPATSAAAAPNAVALQQDMQQMTKEAAQLQQQMQAIQKQLVQMKQEQKKLALADNTTQQVASTTATTSSTTTKKKKKSTANNTAVVPAPANTSPQASPTLVSANNINSMSPAQQQDYYSQLALKALKQSGYMGGSPVTTGPYLGVRSQYNGSDLIINFSSVNTDLAILQQEQQLEDAAEKLGIPLPNHPRLNVSGEVQSQVNYVTNYGGGNSSSVEVSDAELDMVATVNKWVMAYMNFAYTPSPTDGPVNAVAASPIHIDRAFATVGNLNTFPAYMSVGQLYVPFGQYLTYMINNPLTEDLGRTKARAVVLGTYPKDGTGIMAQVYGFRGYTNISPTAVASRSNNINQWGANADYLFNRGGFSSDTGVSFINNIADSLGMQSSGNPYNIAGVGGFPGFGNTGGSVNEGIVHNVQAIDARETAGYGPFTFIGEYTGAVRPFAASNLSFNGSGATPQALDIEGAYTFNLMSKPTSFAVGYNHSWQALGLAFPQNSYAATINVAFFRDVLASFEYVYSSNYSSSDTAGGNNFGGAVTPIPPPGRSQNEVIGQLTAFF